jgi:hypothetical protein
MRGMRAFAVLAVALAACASGRQEGGAASSEFTFLDSGLFDQTLSKTMWGKTDPILVNMAAIATVNDVPERLDKWLYQIGESTGGKVQIEPDPALPQSRDLAMLGLSLAIQAYSFAKEKVVYHPARYYDATLFVDPADGRITRVMFTLRPEVAAGQQESQP